MRHLPCLTNHSTKEPGNIGLLAYILRYYGRTDRTESHQTVLVCVLIFPERSLSFYLNVFINKTKAKFCPLYTYKHKFSEMCTNL